MSTKESTVEYILDQLIDVPAVRARKMFGEYALYASEKVVALICDDTLFVKITDAGKAFVGDRYEESFAYPGAKPSMKINADYLEEKEWLAELIIITEKNLPAPKRKKKYGGFDDELCNLAQEMVRSVEHDDVSVEEAAHKLVSFLLMHKELLDIAAVRDLFDALSEADLPREVSCAQPMGTWSQEKADALKEAEWRKICATIDTLNAQ